MRLMRWALVVVAALILLPYLITPFYLVVRPASTLMAWRWIMGKRVERTWAPLDAISPALPIAVITAEDVSFCRHHGVDWRELRHVIEDAEDGGETPGGSTITQQIAKNLFLWQERSYLRKIMELPLALWIDLVLGKRRVLEIYLNVAEWGPDGTFGAEAGARRAFAKSARELSLHEAALMAAVLPNPVARNAARPRPGVRRIAGIYEARARVLAGRDACVRQRRLTSTRDNRLLLHHVRVGRVPAAARSKEAVGLAPVGSGLALSSAILYKPAAARSRPICGARSGFVRASGGRRNGRAEEEDLAVETRQAALCRRAEEADLYRGPGLR
jgi:monofunctional biosynthetic peptidoglycan transglycosylase